MRTNLKTNLKSTQSRSVVPDVEDRPQVPDIPQEITDDSSGVERETQEQFVPNELRNMAELYLEKQKVYDSSYKDIGKIFDVFFPDGLTIKGTDDWNRIILLSFIMTKVIRHKHSFHTKVFQWDSLQDLSVYSIMLMEIEDAMVDKGTMHRSHAIED